MSERVVAFDLEIARELPEGDEDWRHHAPLGISCAATLDSNKNLRLWHGSTLQMDFMRADYPPQMSSAECRELAQFLVEMQVDGYTVITWNGLGFDLPVLAQECGDVISFDNLRDLALAHIDIGFAMFCEKGFMIGLDTAAKGMGLAGKTKGMHGALAPAMWRQGRLVQEKVLEYVAQDVRVTLGVYEAIVKQGCLRWTSRTGRLQVWQPISGGLTNVKGAQVLPEPDVSWMNNPWSRKKFCEWAKEE